MRAFSMLIGFLLMFSFPAGKITVFPLGGFALILFSVLRMEKMEPIFKKSKIILLIALPFSAALLGLQIYASFANVGAWYEYVYFAVRLIMEICELLAMAFIYAGMKIIGKNAETPSLEKHASRNMTVMFVYFVLEIAINLLSFVAPQVFVGFEFIKIWPFIFGYIWHSLNVLMAFTLLTKISVSKS